MCGSNALYTPQYFQIPYRYQIYPITLAYPNKIKTLLGTQEIIVHNNSL